MSALLSSPLRTPWLGALAALLLIWSLYSLDMSRVTSGISSSLHTNIKTGESHITPVGSNSAIAVDSEAHESSDFSITSSSSVQKQEPFPELVISERPLILYAYFETPNARTNFEFFLRHGLHAAADFVFIMNGPTNITEMIPKEPNFKVIQRANDCYDIGAYSEVLQTNDFYKGYKRFILLNASLRGPFVPYWANSCWSDMYLGRLSHDVKLVGMTANCSPSFHVQSMILATDIIGIETLLFPSEEVLNTYAANPSKSTDEEGPHQTPGMNGCFHTWASAVAAEISLTPLLHAAGYEVDVMMSAFHGMGSNYESTCDPEVKDVLWDKEYYGINVHPFETVFMKSNRDVDPLALERHTEWVEKRGYSSYDYCKAPGGEWDQEAVGGNV